MASGKYETFKKSEWPKEHTAEQKTCIKCGSEYPLFIYRTKLTDDEATTTVIFSEWLDASCQRCGYKWRLPVLGQAELNNASRDVAMAKFKHIFAGWQENRASNQDLCNAAADLFGSQ